MLTQNFKIILRISQSTRFSTSLMVKSIYRIKELTLILDLVVLLLQHVDIGLIVVVARSHLSYVVSSGFQYLRSRCGSRDFLAFYIRYSIAEAVKTVFDVIATLPLQRIVMSSLPVGLKTKQKNNRILSNISKSEIVLVISNFGQFSKTRQDRL